jgi:hypothetical protein
MYKLVTPIIGTEIQIVKKLNEDGTITYIPLTAIDNTDYQEFKKKVLAGAELQDADGNVMTQEQANEFINTLPQ